MRKIFLTTVAFFALSFCFCQTTSKTLSSSGLSGQFLLSYDGSAFYFNMGGPNITYNLNKHSKFSISMLPSLRLINDPVKPTVTPIFGTGPVLQLKKFVVGFPCY